jgi:hypothetical protein
MKFRGRNKFNAKRVNGFASKLEAAVYSILIARQMAGEIKNIKCQQVVVLSDAKINYKADFSYEAQDGSTVWVEAKGVEQEIWRLKKKLWSAYGPGKLEIYKGSYQRPFLAETLVPK